MPSVGEILRDFCQESSLRGANRLVSSNSRGLRYLWIGYLLAMSLLLAYQIHTCFSDYSRRSTVTEIRHSFRNTEFPATTICNFYPFSERAAEIWRRGLAPSPSNFSWELRRHMRHHLFMNRVNEAYQFYNYDSLRVYYQNLDYETSFAIGHSPADLFLYCVLRYDETSVLNGDLEDCQLNARLLNHPDYFNCFTVEIANPALRRRVKSVSLIVHLPQSIADHSNHLIQDFAKISSGALVLLHEHDQLPNLYTRSTMLERGSVLTINYNAKRLVEDKSQLLDHCVRHKARYIVDLLHTYQYDAPNCVDALVNQYTIDSCRCMLAYYPRPFPPNQSVPYCGHIDRNVSHFFDRLRCLSQIDFQSIRSALYKERCQQGCSNVLYDFYAVVNSWRPNMSDIVTYIEFSHALKGQGRARRSLPRLYNQSRRVWDGAELPCASLQIQKNSLPVVTEEEYLEVSISTLICRIGGVCSLTLGLSFAFLPELLEVFCRLLGQIRVTWMKETGVRSSGDSGSSPEMTRLDSIKEQRTGKTLSRGNDRRREKVELHTTQRLYFHLPERIGQMSSYPR